jgi:restriction system protein
VDKLHEVMLRIERFESGVFQAPADAEKLIVEIFQACGHAVSQKGFAESDDGVDCFVRTNFNGLHQTIGVEVKPRRQPAGFETVDKALDLKATRQFDRVMVISRSGFSTNALQHANTVGLGQIDLFSPADLRIWLSKQIQPKEVENEYNRILRGAMRDLALLIAKHPETLANIEWRELEKVLRETFEGIGFDTRLTRPGKDGGFDLELSSTEGGQKRVYLVEVKHWTDQKPGPTHLKKFISVTASKRADGGLLLSTSGFAGTIYSGIAEFSAPVRLAEGAKVVALCRTYYRLRSSLWLEDVNLRETLLSGTRAIGEY